MRKREKILFDEYYSKEKDIVTGIVQRYVGKNVSINLGKVDAILTENEQVKGEVFQPTERIKVYNPGSKIYLQRTESACFQNTSGTGKTPCSNLKLPK